MGLTEELVLCVPPASLDLSKEGPGFDVLGLPIEFGYFHGRLWPKGVQLARVDSGF